MPSTDNGSTKKRDPRSVAVVLVVVVGGLALAFPKPDRAPPVPLDPITAPAGFDLHSLAEADEATCIIGEQRQTACRMMGVSEKESRSLEMIWSTPMGEDFKSGTPIEVTGARLLLIENHQDDYQGELLLNGTIVGVRTDPRTFRFPAEGSSPALDALLSQQLSSGALTLTVIPPATVPSSIDEFTPSLEFAWRVAR